MRRERFKTSPSWPNGPSPRLAHQPRPRHGSLGRKKPSVAATFASCCELPSSPGIFGRVFPVDTNCAQPSVAAAELLTLYQQHVFQVPSTPGTGILTVTSTFLPASQNHTRLITGAPPGA